MAIANIFQDSYQYQLDDPHFKTEVMVDRYAKDDLPLYCLIKLSLPKAIATQL